MQTKPDNGHQRSARIPRAIVHTGKFLQWISNDLAALYGMRLFVSPLRHKMPKREFHMNEQSKQTTHKLPNSSKEIVVYEYGDSKSKVLLAHGWSGRGTQLVKFADALLKVGFSTVSFDAPAHGKAKGKTTNMLDFIEAIHYIEEHFGPFEGAVGHSLGGMSLLNAVREGLAINRLVTIGSGDIVTDIVKSFTELIALRPEIAALMVTKFEHRFGGRMNDHSASLAAKEVAIPVLVIHDENDTEIPVSSAHNIRQNLRSGALLITKGRGHRKILGTPSVVDASVDFILKNRVP